MDTRRSISDFISLELLGTQPAMNGWAEERQGRVTENHRQPYWQASTWKMGTWHVKISPSHNYLPLRKTTVSRSGHTLPGGLDPPLSQLSWLPIILVTKHQDPHKKACWWLFKDNNQLRGQETEAKTGGLYILKTPNSEYHAILPWRQFMQFLCCQGKKKKKKGEPGVGLWTLPWETLSPNKTGKPEGHNVPLPSERTHLSLESVPFSLFLFPLINSWLLLWATSLKSFWPNLQKRGGLQTASVSQ